MVKESCLYYEKRNDMGTTIHWCQKYPHLNFDCKKCERYIEKKFVRVVRCKDCKFGVLDGTKYFCRIDGGIWCNGDWFCANGERREDGQTDQRGSI